jgi:hypothetical protein
MNIGILERKLNFLTAIYNKNLKTHFLLTGMPKKCQLQVEIKKKDLAFKSSGFREK